jgi:hypothetical protein
MAMPKATVHKDAGAVLSKYEIRMTWQPLMVQPISETSLPQTTSHNHLRIRVFRPDGRHILMALLCGESVHIDSF